VFRIVTFYVLFSSLWIYLSDAVLFKVIHDPSLLTRVEICKGFLFILITAIILYVLICRYILRAADANRRRQSSEEHFQAICDNLSEAVLILNADTGKIIEANRAMCGMFGYSRSEALQLEMRELGPGDSSNFDAAITEMLSRDAGNAPQFFEWQARKKNGALFWAETSMQKAATGNEDKVIALVRDVTERKRFEEKLKLMEFSINNVSDAVYWITAEGRFWNVNAAACKMLGYSREELLSMSVLDIDREYSLEERESNREKLTRTGTIRLERSHWTGDGRIIPVEITANYFRYNNQGYTCSIVRDITERVEAEKEASFFRSLIEYTRDPIYVLDRNDGFRMAYANQAACSHFGKSLEQLQTMRIPDWDPVFDMDNMDSVQQRMRQMKSARFETMHRVASGDLVPVEVTSNYLVHGGRELSVGYFCNISERKGMESELKDSEARFRMLSQEFQALLNGIPDGLTLLSPDLKVLWVNSTMEQVMCMEQSAIIGRHCYELRHDRDAPCDDCPVQTCFATGMQDMRTLQYPPDRIVELRAIPVKDDNGNVIKVIEIGRDITEQVNLQHQLRHSQKMEAVGQLAGGVAHDFNNILTATIGFASLMLMKMDPDNPLRHYVEQILSSSEKAAILTQSLLSFSRKKVMSLHPADLNEIIKNAKNLLMRLLTEDIELKLKLCPEALTVIADSVQLEQVLMNLVSNARDAMQDGGALLIKTEPFSMDASFTHLRGYGKPGGYACISVSDTGGGMDEKTREKIFEPFFTTKELGKGTGLGLAMVYGIIKQHNGYINVYSEPGHGTTFKLYLPLVSGAVAEKEKPESAFHRGSAETVLLAEDDEMVRKANREILENFGYNVIEAKDGEDAIDKFAGNKDRINMLMLDVIMPKRNGREVYDAVRKIRADVKALFISGYTADFIAQKGFLDKNAYFIGKPVSTEKFLSKISEVLNN
jgi:PAS domain S-box-containing protein